MEKLRHANSFRDLIVYEKAQSIARKIFEITTFFPKEEMYSLTDQVRRSSRSVGAQIAEAWAKRKYIKHFTSKLTDSDGEQLETQHWIDTAAYCGYIDVAQKESLNNELSEIGKMLNSMMNKAELFCGNYNYSVSESVSEYFTDN
jgi:four helix bundle protein